ncbi:MAG: hypothetical protein ACTHJM_12820 [Marmoricola sp.]
MNVWKNNPRADEGASLIFALILITVVAIITGALITQGNTNFAATVALRRVASTSYAADAAAKIAINDLVQGQNSGLTSTSASTLGTVATNTPNGWVYDNNTDGTGCFGKDTSGNALGSITLPNVYTDSQSATGFSAKVVCAPVAGTGLLAPGFYVQPQPSTSAFGRALTTVGTTNGADGINLKVLGSGSLPIRGSVASTTTINVTNGPIQSSGAITANTSPCASSGGGGYSPACTYGGITAPADPGSPLGPLLPTGAGLPYRDPSTEGCSFLAGYYNNGAALSSAVNACATGAAFASGIYYFDFADGNPWTINTTVIGGQPGSGASIPGRCVSPINNSTTAGVQFVFGNNSQIVLGNSAQVELCGKGNGTNPPITIYQVQSDVSGTPTTLPAATAGTVGNPSPLPNKYDSFSPTPSSTTLQADLATVGDSHTANWTASKAGNSAELDLQNFAGLSSIPNGSTITSAMLKVNYTKSSAAGTFTVGVNSQTPTVTLAPSGSNTNITSALNAQFAASSGATPFSATNPMIKLLVGGSTAKNDTFNVDAATLTVSYTTPPIRHATGVNTTTTPFISTGNNFSGKFVVNGSTYAPQGYITMGPGNATNSVVAFRWGLDAWGVNFKAQPQQLFGVPLVSIPDGGYGQGSSVTDVDLKVYLCTDSSCTTPTLALTARVGFTDNVCTAAAGCSTANMGTVIQNSVDPTPGQRQVQILSWAEQK